MMDSTPGAAQAGLEPGQGALQWLGLALGRVSGRVVIDRLPVLPKAMPAVEFDGLEELEDFLSALEAVAPRVVYADTLDYDDAAFEADLGRMESAAEDGHGVDGADALRAQLKAAVDTPSGAALLFLADGVGHRVRMVDDTLHSLRMPVLIAESAQRQAWRSAGFVDVAAERRKERERFAPVVDGLEQRLREDEEFLATGTSDVLRRAYAQQLVLRESRESEIPAHVRGEISAAAEGAWRWWRATGRPARGKALLERVPDLAGHPSLVGVSTLEERRRAARALLEEVDPLGASPATADALARAAGTRPAAQLPLP